MDKKRLLLILQSALCIILTIMLAAAVIGIYRDGAAMKATDPLSWIFTREKVAEAFSPVFPILVLSLVLTGIGLIMGIRGEEINKSAKEKENKTDSSTQILRAAVLILALVLIVAGASNGSAGDVFNKAVKICTECIGFG